MAGRRKGKGASGDDGRRPAAPPVAPAPPPKPEQLALPLGAPPKRPGRKARRAAAAPPEPTAAAGAGNRLSPPVSRAPTLRVLEGGGEGAGHARGRLLVVGGSDAPVHLPDRAELDRVLLGALADLLAGRISATAAAAIREAAVAAIRAHDHVDADPDRLPELIRAARALRELVGTP